MTKPAKIVAAKRRAGELVLRMLLRYQQDVVHTRYSMHWSYERFGVNSSAWLMDYKATKHYIQDLRAARLLYDKLPEYAK